MLNVSWQKLCILFTTKTDTKTTNQCFIEWFCLGKFWGLKVGIWLWEATELENFKLKKKRGTIYVWWENSNQDSCCCYAPTRPFNSSSWVSHRGPTSHLILQGEYQSWWHPADLLKKVKIVLLPSKPGDAHPNCRLPSGSHQIIPLVTAIHPFSKLYSPIPRTAHLQSSKRFPCFLLSQAQLSL